MEPYSSDDVKRRKRKRYPNIFYPKDQLCPRCGTFLVGGYKYNDSSDEESKKPTPQEFIPKKETIAKKLPGVRKKARNKNISLNQDIINLNGDNEYLKFCGITTTDRTQLFASNKKWLYLLELTNNLDFIASSILGGDLDKMLLKSENSEEEKCQFFEKNKIIYVIYGKFPDKKGKWVLEQMEKYFSDLIRGKDVNNLSSLDKYDIEKKFKGNLLFILNEYLQLQEVFTDPEILYVEDWLRLDYIGLSSMSIGVISILLDNEEILNVKGPEEFEDPAEGLQMKESLLAAKLEAIAANTLGNTGAYPRWIAVKLGFQKYRYIAFRRFKNDYFLTCLAEGNLEKIEEAIDLIAFFIEPAINLPFSGNLREFNKIKAKLRKFFKEISKVGLLNLSGPKIEELRHLIAKRVKLGQRLGSEDLDKIKMWENRLSNYYSSGLMHDDDDDDDDTDFYPFPFIFTPPKPPDDFPMAPQAQVRVPSKVKEPEDEINCQYCGKELTKEEQITHSCKTKPE